VLVIVIEPVVPMVILLPLLVAKFNVLVVLKYIPFAGTALLVTLTLAAVIVELNVALVPLNALLTNVTVVPSSVIALSPIALALVNLARVFVVPVPVTVPPPPDADITPAAIVMLVPAVMTLPSAASI
jgi:hypothetical protein